MDDNHIISLNVNINGMKGSLKCVEREQTIKIFKRKQQKDSQKYLDLRFLRNKFMNRDGNEENWESMQEIGK